MMPWLNLRMGDENATEEKENGGGRMVNGLIKRQKIY
jgi:hypothetical protein